MGWAFSHWQEPDSASGALALPVGPSRTGLHHDLIKV